jgi:hypothetical protein
LPADVAKSCASRVAPARHMLCPMLLKREEAAGC